MRFDTHFVVKRLVDVGISEPAAETFVETIQKITAASYENLATKQDLEDVRKDLEDVRVESKRDILDVRKDLAGVERDLRSEMRLIEHRLTIKMGGMIMAAVAAIGAMQKFL